MYGPGVASTSDSVDLADHGDRQVPPGTVDLAVNVLGSTPRWLREELAALDLAHYPSTEGARAAAAARHGVAPEQCLLTNGAAEAFWALAYGLRPRLAACVHPSFTAPEAALRSAGVAVHRVVRSAADGFALDLAAVPEEADMVVVGRPDNPTGRVEPLEVVAALTRPGRTVVVDEAFADFLPNDETLATLDLPGVVCVRSLTKLWGLAGLRAGYLLGDPATITRAGAALQPWPVNALAAHAVQRLSDQQSERSARAGAVARARTELLDSLRDLPHLRVWPSPANFVLLGFPFPGARERLLEHGLAARRCDSFPGLDDTYVRVAVHEEPRHRAALTLAVRSVLSAT